MCDLHASTAAARHRVREVTVLSPVQIEQMSVISDTALRSTRRASHTYKKISRCAHRRRAGVSPRDVDETASSSERFGTVRNQSTRSGVTSRPPNLLLLPALLLLRLAPFALGLYSACQCGVHLGACTHREAHKLGSPPVIRPAGQTTLTYLTAGSRCLVSFLSSAPP